MNENELMELLVSISDYCPYKFDDTFDYKIVKEEDEIAKDNITAYAISKKNGSIYSLAYNQYTYILSATLINIENIPRLDDIDTSQFFYDCSKYGIRYHSMRESERCKGNNSIFRLMADLATKFEIGTMRKGWSYEIDTNFRLLQKDGKIAFDLLYKFNQTLYNHTQLRDISLFSPPESL